MFVAISGCMPPLISQLFIPYAKLIITDFDSTEKSIGQWATLHRNTQEINKSHKYQVIIKPIK